MDVIGKQVLKGTVEKQFQKFSGSNEAEGSADLEDDGLTNEERRNLQEALREKNEKMLKVQAKRRMERAKTREEIRKKHNLKSSEEDQKVLEQSAATFSLFNLDSDDEENSIQQAVNTVLTKIKDTWEQIKEGFSNT
ncbi:uncharacterized protein LOC143453469 [Clavelina lepadiformis]|uniref:uncharacterized protein LOC143453469 n=1 Tax=Clavelina lepadiformis TaxID=159417 RepID=UPI00404328AB